MEKKGYHKIALHHAFLHAYIFSHIEQQTKSYVQESLLQYLINIACMHVVSRDMSTIAIYKLERTLNHVTQVVLKELKKLKTLLVSSCLYKLDKHLELNQIPGNLFTYLLAIVKDAPQVRDAGSLLE